MKSSTMNTADLTQKLNSNFNATIKLFYATGYNYICYV